MQPTKGRITVAGEDLRTFDKSEWARAVSLVNQVYSFSYIINNSVTFTFNI